MAIPIYRCACIMCRGVILVWFLFVLVFHVLMMLLVDTLEMRRFSPPPFPSPPFPSPSMGHLLGYVGPYVMSASPLRSGVDSWGFSSIRGKVKHAVSYFNKFGLYPSFLIGLYQCWC